MVRTKFDIYVFIIKIQSNRMLPMVVMFYHGGNVLPDQNEMWNLS
jgi:hypothetical protein